MYRESNIEAYITICKIQWEFVVCLRELKQQLCIDLEGWEGGDGREEMGGRFKRKGTYVYLWLIHVEIWQKTPKKKFSKALFLQLKNK